MTDEEPRERQHYDDTLLGQWVRRLRATSGKAITRWHKVETIRNERPIAHCGREFGKRDGTILIYAPAAEPGERCGQCIVSRK
jgi:hypothetical protein